MNNRRKLVITLGAGALVAPLACFAQRPDRVWRVGFLSARSRPVSLDSDEYSGFPQGMRELGYVEGKNLMIDWRYAEGKYERLTELVAELVRLKVDVIVAAGSPVISAAQKAGASVPIVAVNAQDPVGSGFIKSLARPGGNITGLSSLASDIGPKHLEMLLGMVPKLTRVAVLVNFDNPSHSVTLKNIQAAAEKANAKAFPVDARTAPEIEKAFSTMAREKAGAVIVARDALFLQQARQIAELAAKNRLPTISGIREYMEAGGLIIYGPNSTDSFRRAATYVDKILKGAKPGDLPVEQPTKFELVVNMKTAKALGITIPQSILISADKVIE